LAANVAEGSFASQAGTIVESVHPPEAEILQTARESLMVQGAQGYLLFGTKGRRFKSCHSEHH